MEWFSTQGLDFGQIVATLLGESPAWSLVIITSWEEVNDLSQ